MIKLFVTGLLVIYLLLVLLLTGCGDVYNTNNNQPEPQAYIDLCERNGVPFPDTKMKNEKKEWGDLYDVFYPLYDNFDYVLDEEKRGVLDYWELLPENDLNGDCEDFALTLKRRLLNAGFNNSDVKIVLCNTNTSVSGIYNHTAIIITLADDSRYVLDQINIKPFEKCYYEFIKVLDDTGLFWLDY